MSRLAASAVALSACLTGACTNAAETIPQPAFVWKREASFEAAAPDWAKAALALRG